MPEAKAQLIKALFDRFEQDKPDPRADEITGCLPVTADGQMPR